ncbi:MAG: ABC transporter substrate-binding protein [Clostridia bacterium]|nr:ABC transporter substrate-binding protein [Clostridia bacterium]
MFRNRIILVLVLVLAMTFTLSACGEGETSNVFRVGIDDTYPPMEYRNEAGEYAGFDVDLAQEIAKRLDRELEFVPTAWTAIFTALSSNKYDCIISSLSITEERKKTIVYTRPYVANNQVIIVRKDNADIASENDLGDKIVAVQMGTTSDDACVEFQKATPFKEYKKYEGMNQALNELKIGRVDAVVTDLVIGKYFVANDMESFNLVIATLPNEPIAVGFNKSNQKARDEVDKVLEEMMNDGSLSAISKKWFGEDMTKNLE